MPLDYPKSSPTKSYNYLPKIEQYLSEFQEKTSDIRTNKEMLEYTKELKNFDWIQDRQQLLINNVTSKYVENFKQGKEKLSTEQQEINNLLNELQHEYKESLSNDKQIKEELRNLNEVFEYIDIPLTAKERKLGKNLDREADDFAKLEGRFENVRIFVIF